VSIMGEIITGEPMPSITPGQARRMAVRRASGVDLEMENDLQYRMALLEICRYPDPVLRKISTPVGQVTDEIVLLSSNMLETMRCARGLGLAAIQVGVPIRLVIVDPSGKKVSDPIVLINPVIVDSSEEETIEEGCLSVPGFYEFVKRAGKVVVQGHDLKEKPLEIECDGYVARAFQHEVDHLDGVLFIDHLSPVKKGLFKKQFPKNPR
jgi:peptide deformylase